MSSLYGVFFAVLPVKPSVSPEQLREACESIAPSAERNEANAPYILTWTHHRVSQLNHPALQDPLRFIEISCKLVLFDKENETVEQACASIVTLLEQREPTIIGKVELLLILEDTPIPLLPSAVPMDGCADTFHKYGLVGMIDAIDNLDGLYELALTTFERLYALIQRKRTHRFKEIMQRDDKRFDFRLDLMDDRWKEYEKRGKWKNLVADILGDDYSIVKCGCVLSMPGAGMQYYHSDGVHTGETASFESEEAELAHAVCVFVPLIDLNHKVGFTEFWAGSHRYNKLLDKKGEQALPGGTDGILKKGDCLLYDYRTIHRGTANESHVTRPVCYFLYSKKGFETVEDQNFASESIFD